MKKENQMDALAIHVSRQPGSLGMDNGTYTTKVKTQNGAIYDLGKREYPPIHHHPSESPCDECFVVNAWAEKEEFRK